MLDFYRRLIRLRKSRPELSDPRLDRVQVTCGAEYLVMSRDGLAVVGNFARAPRRVALPGPPRDVLFATDPGLVLIRSSIELPAQSAAVVACG